MPFDKKTAREAGQKSSRKGKPNRLNAELRTVVNDLLDANAETILQDIAKLEPRDRINAWIRLLEFALPKLNRTQSEISGPEGLPLETVIRFVDDSQDNLLFERMSTVDTLPKHAKQEVLSIIDKTSYEHDSPQVKEHVPKAEPTPLPPLPPLKKEEPGESENSGVVWV